MNPGTPTTNPRYAEFFAVIEAHPEWVMPWRGCFFRFQTIHYPTPKDILSGSGARQRGGRWNPPGVAAIYGSTSETTALEESKANDRYYGIVTKTPRLLVAIEAEVPKMLDLTNSTIRRHFHVTLKELAAEDWRKLLETGRESLSQAIGRAAAVSWPNGILVRSSAVPQGRNVVLYPPLGTSGRLAVVEGDKLARLKTGDSA